MAQRTTKPLPYRETLAAALATPETRPGERLNFGARLPALPLIAALLIAIFLLSLALGSVNIPLDQTLVALLGGATERESWANIILKFRLPKALTAMLAGAALSAGGLMMQTLFRNPLASSDVLGITSGASLGAALVVLASGAVGGTLLAGASLAGDLSIAAAAMLGSALTLALVVLLARRFASSVTLLIFGLMIGHLTFALVSLLLYFSIPERIQAYINWGFGSFGGLTWGQMPILAGGVGLGLLLAASLVKTLNALLLGEAYAASLGVDVGRARLAIIISTALLTGVVTAFCGPIGFIGIAAPHLARGLLNTSDHRLLLPGVCLLGALAALLAALLAELPGTSLILPLNTVMALFGVPVVMWVIARGRALQGAFVG